MTTPTEWASSPDHPGYRVKIIERDNFTIEILRPELSAEEQTKREAHLKAVAERTLSNYYKRKERTS
jgi:hypothetical protein